MMRHARAADPHDREPRVPPVLPLIAVAVKSAAEVTISVDGVFIASGPIDRASLGRVLTALVAEQGVPCRVELTEADGRRFADIVTPVPPSSRFAPPQPTPVVPPRAAPPSLHHIEGEGFLPGEDVGVAVVIRSGSADPAGHARALIEDRELPSGHFGVLLFGFESGTLHREELG